jgi:hypothetical protein
VAGFARVFGAIVIVKQGLDVVDTMMVEVLKFVQAESQ